MSTPVAEVHDAGVLLGGRPVLRGIDLAVADGEVVAVLGANGSGKTTLVRTLLGLVPLHRGEARLFGTPLARFRDWSRVGYVPQRATAAAGVPASVREVVASGRLGHRHLWRPAGREDRRAVDEALAAVGLADRARDGVAMLSGGQHQRVLVARALAARPELVVLDEPTAGVDLVQQDNIAGILGRIHDGGGTVVLVAHELGPLAPLVSRTVVMRDGRVAYDGPPLESFTEAGATHQHGHGHVPDRPSTVDWSPDVTSPFDPTTEERLS